MVGFLYRRMAGIAPAAPGFRKIRVEPFFDARVGAVSMRYQSCLGPIASRMEGDAQGLARLDLDIPANVTAEVLLPPGRRWREGRKAVDGARIEIGSGQWRFSTL